MKRHILTTLILLTFTGFLPAQQNTRIPPDTFAISSNVLGLITLNPTLDIEMKFMKSLTLGATVWWEVYNVEDRWGQIKITYYFGNYAMKGFGLSITGGVHRAYKESDAAVTIKPEATSATLGMLASYTWRFGNSERLFITPMIGFRKTLSDTGGDSPLEPYYPEARINLGVAF